METSMDLQQMIERGRQIKATLAKEEADDLNAYRAANLAQWHNLAEAIKMLFPEFLHQWLSLPEDEENCPSLSGNVFVYLLSDIGGDGILCGDSLMAFLINYQFDKGCYSVTLSRVKVITVAIDPNADEGVWQDWREVWNLRKFNTEFKEDDWAFWLAEAFEARDRIKAAKIEHERLTAEKQQQDPIVVNRNDKFTIQDLLEAIQEGNYDYAKAGALVLIAEKLIKLSDVGITVIRP